MRAAVIDKPFSIGLQEVRPPRIKDANEVKIQVIVTGICGSEIHAYHGTHPFRIPPVISGHEFAGVVVETGSEVKSVSVGDRVTVEPHYGCGICRSCQTGNYNICKEKNVLGTQEWIGSFGEFIVVPEKTIVKLPDNVTFEQGALIEPLAVGVHAVRKAGVSQGGKQFFTNKKEYYIMQKWFGSSGVCINENGELLMVLQGKPEEQKKWSTPSGGKEHNETFQECCVREIEEKTR